MSPLSSIGLHYSFAPLVMLINHTLSTISPTAFETDSLSGPSHLTSMSPLSSIGLHYSFSPLVILFDHPLNNLALGLCDRFTQWGIPSDLDESIKLYQAALLLRPPVSLLQLNIPLFIVSSPLLLPSFFGYAHTFSHLFWSVDTYWLI
ncbi:hypothetical protein BDR07DRAFT_1495926 [Suillus spraguei]|nr:hypothetical protein BDR07DRAFT_1495926 [Suillus spraguei]